MQRLIIYIHGKGGSAAEAAHSASLFPGDRVVGFDYHAGTPWEARDEFSAYFDRISAGYEEVYIVACSLGAFFTLCSLGEKKITKVLLLSPVLDMEELILKMMTWANVTEEELAEKKEIPTDFGETLSIRYLSWVREHPIRWQIPTGILYGSLDDMHSMDTVKGFAARTGASLTILEGGEHWIHTEEQVRFLDKWLLAEINGTRPEPDISHSVPEI